MSSSQVIIRRKAGQKMPEAFLTAALAACPNAWGIAYVEGGKLELKQGEKIDLEDIRSAEDNFGDFTMCLVNSPNATNLKDYGPYELAARDDEPVVAVFIDGEFPGFVKEKSSHPAAYHFANYISDQVIDLLDNVDGNIDKALEKIGGDRFKEKIKMNTVSRGYLTFVAENDKAVSITQGDTAKEYPWGWVSNTFGWDAEKKEEPKEEKKKSIFSKRSTVREKAQVNNDVVVSGAGDPPKADTAVKAPEGNGLPAKPKQDTKPVILSLENITVKKVKCPDHYSRKQRRTWAKQHIGHIPPNLDQNGNEYEVYVSPTGRLLSREEVQKALGMSAAKLPALNNPKHEKNPDPDNIDAGKQVSTNPLPIVSPTGRKRMTGFISDERIQKVISENASVIADPDKVQGHEAKIEPLRVQLGMKDMNDFDCLPFPEIQKIAATNFHDICCLMWDYRRRALQAEHKLKRIEKTGQLMEETPQKVEEQPPKRSMFSRRSAA